MYKKFYQNKIFVLILQAVTISMIVVAKIDLILQVMLVFGYVMLFRQERWHKHLLLMFLMMSLLTFASGGFGSFIK